MSELQSTSYCQELLDSLVSNMNVLWSDAVTCSECLRKFPSRAKYKYVICMESEMLRTASSQTNSRHEKTHSRPYKCALCDQSFALNADLRRHQVSHGSVQKKYKCNWPKCGFKGTSRKDDLRKHMRRHRERQAETEADALQALYDEAILQQAKATKEFPTFSALITAARNGNCTIVQLLLDKGVSLTGSTADGKTVLHAAAMSGSGDMVNLLLTAGIDSEVQDSAGNSALHYASVYDQLEIIDVIAKTEASLSTRNLRGETALYIAAMRGYESAFELLVDKGASLNLLDDKKADALCRASDAGHATIVRLLISTFGTLNWRTGPALFGAAQNGHCKIVDILVSYCPEIGCQRMTKRWLRAAVVEASRKGHHKIVESLLACKNDLKVGAREGPQKR